MVSVTSSHGGLFTMKIMAARLVDLRGTAGCYHWPGPAGAAGGGRERQRHVSHAAEHRQAVHHPDRDVSLEGGVQRGCEQLWGDSAVRGRAGDHHAAGAAGGEDAGQRDDQGG